MKKKILAVVLAATMVIGSAISVAAESVVGVAWWDGNNTSSTAVALEDGSTVTFQVETLVTDDFAEGAYAAFMVELNDGTNYVSTTSDGDCWFFPADGHEDKEIVKNTGVAGVVAGQTYTVVVTRSGDKFTVQYLDASGVDLGFGTLSADSSIEFGDTTVYVMGQAGNLEVTVVENSEEETTVEETTADDGSAEDETTAAADDNAATTTGDVATIVMIVAMVGAAAALVVLKKRVTE